MSEVKLPPGYHQGIARPYYTSSPIPAVVGRAVLGNIDRFCLFSLLAVGVLVRLYKLPYPSEVVFDEVNFGSYIHEYFHGRFFIDVHPPLIKLLYYWCAILFGYDGEFEFSHVDEKYDQNVPYVALRLVSATCGLVTIPVTYLILRHNYCGPVSALFGSFLVLIENSMVTQSRFFFLDSPLILFTAVTMLGFSMARNSTAFSGRWHANWLLTGVFLGLACSSKSSGLLTYGWIGILAFLQLWTVLGDLEVSDFGWWKHLVARIVYLVGVPFTIYLAAFSLHFHALPNVGPGAGPMTPQFKATFKDYDTIRKEPVEVVYGSTVTLKHNEVGKYLHSHPFNYKTGSKEQQVTLYSYHTDYNNEWEIHPKTKRTDMRLFDQVNPIKNGDVVRLFHKATGKFLHVNNVRPPITEKDYANEVSCNGTRDLLGDINYEFKIHILDKKPHSKNNLPNIKLRATESVFQLFHQGTRCSLVAHQGKLPGWAFGQNEVLCINQPTIPNTLWYVEYNSHPMLDKDQSSERVNLGGLTFWKKFVEYQKVMWMFNKGMGGSHEYGSRPEAWPFLIRGTNYYSTDARVKTADEPGSHIYYFGNLAIYYFGVMAILFIGLKQVFYLINHLNPFMLPNETTNVSMFYQATMETILGYVVHYQPYFMMERELFLHHYLPAIYFCILTVTYFVEYQISKRKLFGYILVGVIGGLSLGCFVYFSPLIYGTDWSREACREAKWIGSWDFDCRTYKK